jgi:hypothetical protein
MTNRKAQAGGFSDREYDDDEFSAQESMVMTHEERDALLIRLDEWRIHQMRWTETHMQLHARLSSAFIAAVVSTVLALGTTIVSLIIMLSKSGGG